ncbi:MAG: DUF3488 and transglutaminase-like domain-containing protein [Pseudomonadota bacterium]
MKHEEIRTVHVAWLIVTLVLALLPHIDRFPLALSFGFVALTLWRLLGAMKRAPLPGPDHKILWGIKQFIAVFAFVAIYIAYRGQLGRDAGVELLAALLALKILEMRGERDYYIVAFLCYFLLVTNFFYSQTIKTAAFMLAVVILITTVLVQFTARHSSMPTRTHFFKAGQLTAQAVPLMVIAFLLFPRIPGPLWGIPQDAFSGVSGLSEELSLGSIVRLTLIDEVAFRAEFHGDEPRARELYWRGPVLTHTDGRTWRKSPDVRENPPPAKVAGRPYSYTVMLEPHKTRWLFGLDIISNANGQGRITSDYQLMSRRPVQKRASYTIVSHTDFVIDHLTESQRQENLMIPVRSHPRAKALSETWRKKFSSDRDIITAALNMYRGENFIYSLTPPPLLGDTIDAFLFDTQQGFCEHFAASFVVLMRAAGIPARIVTGYQGGERNTVSDFLVIRQRDAHAWAEVYLEDAGWTRVDPTGAVAPGRVSTGIEQLLPSRQRVRRSGNSTVGSAFLRLRDTFEAITYSWNQWVLGYSPAQQRRVLDDLGLEKWNYGTLLIALTLVCASFMLLLAMLVLSERRRYSDDIVNIYAKFQKKLAKIGLNREPSETPRAFCDRVVQSRSDLAREVREITRMYEHLRYGTARLRLSLLKSRVAAFKPVPAKN